MLCTTCRRNLHASLTGKLLQQSVGACLRVAPSPVYGRASTVRNECVLRTASAARMSPCLISGDVAWQHIVRKFAIVAVRAPSAEEVPASLMLACHREPIGKLMKAESGT